MPLSDVIKNLSLAEKAAFNISKISSKTHQLRCLLAAKTLAGAKVSDGLQKICFALGVFALY